MLRASSLSDMRAYSYYQNVSINKSIHSSKIRKRNVNQARASHLCQIDCKKEKRKPVCGNDNITYESRCDLHQTICKGKQVRLQYRGECSQRKYINIPELASI